MTSRLSGGLSGLVAAVVLALAGTLLAPAPAQAATSWQTLYETRRDIRAQACRTGTYTNPQGYQLKAVRWRADARRANLAGSVRLRVHSDRFGRWTSDWRRASAGRVSSAGRTHFLASERVRVRMQVRTRNGKSAWSRAHRLGGLRHC